MGEVIRRRNRNTAFGDGGGGDADGIGHNQVLPPAAPQLPVPREISDHVFDINEFLSNLHPLVIFVLCLLYECFSFFFMIFNGMLFYKLLHSDGVLRSKISVLVHFGSPFYSASLICLFLKLIQDQLETIYIAPLFRSYLRQTQYFQKPSLCVAIVGVCACYCLVFLKFYERYVLLISNRSPNPVLFVLALCYIEYFNVSHGIKSSKPTKYFHDIVQHSLNFQFGRMLLKYGELCGRLLFNHGVNVNFSTFLVTFPPVIMTLGYFALQRIAFRNVKMGSGTKWAEVAWGLVSTDHLFRSYLQLTADNQLGAVAKGIQFYMGTAFLVHLSTKSVAMYFVKVKF